MNVWIWSDDHRDAIQVDEDDVDPCEEDGREVNQGAMFGSRRECLTAAMKHFADTGKEQRERTRKLEAVIEHYERAARDLRAEFETRELAIRIADAACEQIAARIEADVER